MPEDNDPTWRGDWRKLQGSTKKGDPRTCSLEYEQATLAEKYHQNSSAKLALTDLRKGHEGSLLGLTGY